MPAFLPYAKTEPIRIALEVCVDLTQREVVTKGANRWRCTVILGEEQKPDGFPRLDRNTSVLAELRLNLDVDDVRYVIVMC